jgi:Asp/Glu/hydantoin racemase
MRLLAINPNTTDAVTAKLVDAGRAMAPPGLEIIGASGRFGARYISTRSAAAIAGHAALDAYAPHAGQVDGVLLACFGDPGLLALRELADRPVLGLAEAACREAAKGGRRFSIITGGVLWPPMLEELLASLGLAGSLASIRAVAPTGGEIAADPAAAHGVLANAALDAVRQDGAEAVILGGAGLVGIAAAIRDRIPVPVLCSVEAGFRAAFAMLEENAPRSPGAAALPPVGTIGLAPALAALLEGKGTA